MIDGINQFIQFTALIVSALSIGYGIFELVRFAVTRPNSEE